MLDKILAFLKSFNFKDEPPVRQTGIIVAPPEPGEWLLGEDGIVSAVRVPSGDWTPYAPTGEKQHKNLDYDTMSCATFSGLSIIEMFMKYLEPQLTKHHTDFIRLFNFIDANGNFNASDNFTAVMSGTTFAGNTLPRVLESIRIQGIVSERDYPFFGRDFAEYHKKERITPYMKQRAKKFLDYFTVQYSWVHFTQGKTNTELDIIAMKEALKESPLHIGVLIPAVHAEALLEYGGMKTFYDSYEPYIKRFDAIYNPIHFSMRVIVIPKTGVPKFPIPSRLFIKKLTLGMQNDDVMSLQKILTYFGFMNVATGFFGPITRDAVKEFQRFHKLDPVGEVGPLTRSILNSFFTLPQKTNAEILYDMAVSCLNTDVTPADQVPDDVACAETVNAIHKKTFGKEIGGGSATRAMYHALLNNPLWTKVFEPEAGDLVISPTGYGNGSLANGHVGIVGKNNVIMSNSSSTGKFTENFNIDSWKDRYADKGGFPVVYFRKV